MQQCDKPHLRPLLELQLNIVRGRLLYQGEQQAVIHCSGCTLGHTEMHHQEIYCEGGQALEKVNKLWSVQPYRYSKT